MKFHHRFLIALFDSLRPFFGFMNICCIYPVSCSDFAKDLIVNMPLYRALPSIVLRVLSCQPLTVLIKKCLKNKFIKKKQ